MTGSNELQSRLHAYGLQGIDTPLGAVRYRHSGAPLAKTTHVLLHGIGSGSGSWLMQLEAAAQHADHVGALAWEAPGYGASDPVTADEPVALDYAQRIWSWLDALGIQHPVNLVGHSLGALMAASAAAAQPSRVSRLILLAPAQGYGRADPLLRQQKRQDRLQALQNLGPQVMAQQRGPVMLSSHAPHAQLDFVRHLMAQVIPSGYTQATHMLSQGDIASDLKLCSVPLTIASGRADGITTVTSCQALAAECGVAWRDLGDVGHACALEGSAAVNALIGLTEKSTV
jgi:pimeloyl-ACP methyl ester carboxylesterase